MAVFVAPILEEIVIMNNLTKYLNCSNIYAER